MDLIKDFLDKHLYLDDTIMGKSQQYGNERENIPRFDLPLACCS
jgi:hypothetical protein